MKTFKTIIASMTALALFTAMIATTGCTKEETPESPNEIDLVVDREIDVDVTVDDERDDEDEDNGEDGEELEEGEELGDEYIADAMEFDPAAVEQFLADFEAMVDEMVDVAERLEADIQDEEALAEMNALGLRVSQYLEENMIILFMLQTDPEQAEIVAAEMERISGKLDPYEEMLDELFGGEHYEGDGHDHD